VEFAEQTTQAILFAPFGRNTRPLPRAVCAHTAVAVCVREADALDRPLQFAYYITSSVVCSANHNTLAFGERANGRNKYANCHALAESERAKPQRTRLWRVRQP
jgi:hypothetical protein